METDLNTSKAILVVGIAIAVAIVASVALVTFADRDRSAPPVYQLQRLADGSILRLDTRTGEVVACRLQDGRMVCASSESATQLPQMTAEEMADRDDRRERREQEDRMAMFDKFIDLFERMIRLAREAERRGESGDAAPAAPAPGGE